MTGEPPYIREHRRQQQEWDARVSLFRKVANTYAYATMGAGVGGTVLAGDPFTVANTASVMVGLVLHALALYLAPIGAEKPDD